MGMKSIGLCFAVWLLVGNPQFSFATEPGGFTVEKSPQGVLVVENGKKILFYQQQAKLWEGKFQRANYVHPLYDRNGKIITEDFPSDHRHHRGIFWAWHQLWLGEKKLGDSWSTQDFLSVVKSVETKTQSPNTLAIKTKVHWTSKLLIDADGNAVPVVEEQTTITVHPTQEAWRLVDFEIKLLALKPEVKIGGSEDDKGYGGFSARIALSPDTKFRGTKGEVKPKRGAVQLGSWLDVSTAKSGMAILDHPQNPGFPQAWILRQQRSMQNPVYPGREPVAISQQQPLVLKYRLVIHNGHLQTADLDKLQQSWAKTATPQP